MSAFDDDLLRERGVSAAMMKYLSVAPRFTPGDQPVQIIVNGNPIGKKTAKFDGAGELCISESFIQSIGLLPIAADLVALSKTQSSNRCIDLQVVSLRSEIRLEPGIGIVEISVPVEMLALTTPQYQAEVGGIGAMFNYRLSGQLLNVDNSIANTSWFADTVAGFNAGDWIVRSQQSLNADAIRKSIAWNGAYAQKTFVAQKRVLQFGRIVTSDPVFGGTQITGAQWLPEHGLRGRGAFPIKGIATSRTRIEIFQNSLMLLRTTVPAGPYTLTDYSIQNRSSDLEIRETDESGMQHNYRVPVASLLTYVSDQTNGGFRVAAGRLWSASRSDDAPVISGSYGWNRGTLSLTGGLIFSPGFMAAGAHSGTSFGDGNRYSVFGQTLVSHLATDKATGLLASGSISARWSDRLSTVASISARTSGFKNVEAVVARRPVPNATSLSQPQDAEASPLADSLSTEVQMSLSGSWDVPYIGALNAGISRQGFRGEMPTYVYSFGWGGSWHGANLSLGFSQSGDAGLAKKATSFYASLNIPLGQHVSTNAFMHTSDGLTRSGASFNHSLPGLFSYSANTEKSVGVRNENSMGLGISAVPRYTSLSAGFSRTSGGGSSRDFYYGQASGGIVATRDGVALSPYDVQDTFGTASTGSVTGVRIDTPQGPVWSGPGGVAALPSLSPYQDSRIEVATRSVGLDIDVDNGLQVVQAGRGAVISMDMGVRRVRRMMLTVYMPDGSFLKKGSAVLRGDNEFFTAASGAGKVLVTQLNEGESLSAEYGDSQHCVIQDIKTQPDPGGGFESGTARCVGA